MLSIQTNVNSLVAQQNLRVNSTFQSKTIQQLTSGYRINSSGDDAAGLAVANKFRNSIAELTQGVANGNDGVAQLQIMDGGMNNISQMLDRLKTLAMQSASASFTGKRETLNSEFQTDIAEIDRQAQSIGLNTGGTFAKSLQVYLGAGSGSTSTANSVVSVDLTKSTVDSQSLGLTGVQVVNSATYDLSDSSATNVENIIANNGNATSTSFTFFGAGFSNSDSTNANDGITVDVNITGIGDLNSLVDVINTAIQGSMSGTGAKGAFQTANITASVATDADGNQKLAFTSSVAGFEVQAEDGVSNALMGYLDTTANDGTAANQRQTLTQSAADADGVLTMNGTGASLTFLSLTGDGLGATSTKIVLDGLSGAATLGEVADTINSKLSAAEVSGVTAQVIDGTIQIGNANGSIAVTENVGSGNAALGFAAAADSGYGKLVANGAYELGNTTSDSVTNLGFHGQLANGATQDITVSANDSNGSAHALTINLTRAQTVDIDTALGEINSKLQTSNDATLKQITAVKTNTNGVDSINFVSTLAGFQVSVASTDKLNGTVLGLTDSAGAQGKTISSVQNGEGGSADISTMAGAQAAVTAISNAVAALGSAQAYIGKGQNQLNYAIGLAQSQITNFSAAEAQIRDADVAMQAANLTKAQVLQQASMAAMAQANSAPQAVLSLLRG